jgi:integrase
VVRGLLVKLPEFPKIRITTKPRGAFTPSEYWKIIRTSRKLTGKSPSDIGGSLRKNYRLRTADFAMPKDIAWVIGFMVHSFIRPSDLKTLKHRHVEVVRNSNTYLRLTLPETKKHGKPIVTLQPAVRIYEQIVKQRGGKGLAKPDDYVFFNWVLQRTGLKQGPHGQDRSLYSLRHSAITFRLLYGQGIDLLTLARNARTSVEVINNHYASTVSGEQNIALLQSRRSRL